MKIRKLIEDLLKDNSLDDEIIVSYWDKNYFVETNEIDRIKLDTVWTEFVKDGQETVDGHLDFTQTGYDLASDLQELLKEKEKVECDECGCVHEEENDEMSIKGDN